MSGVPDCCICLTAPTRPVSLPCGHAYCLACIGEYWRHTGCCQCPMCKALFPNRPHLKPPPADERTPPPPPPPEPLGAGEVPCDDCRAGGGGAAAVMSCLACLASYCPLHLEPHYLDAALWRHRLVSAVKNAEGDGAACRHHGRKVDRFCRTDRTCVCAVCADTDHRDHRVVSISKEAGRAKAKLNKQLLKLTQTIQERTLHENTGRSLSLRGGRTGDGLGQAEGLGEPEGLLKDQEQEILDLQQRKTDLEELSQMADPLRNFYRSVHRRYEEIAKKITEEEAIC